MMLELKSLFKSYPGGQVALRGIDLKVPEGQIVAIIGSSGAGKSTLIRCINRLVEPTSGTVRVDGQDITRLSAKQLRRSRRRIGVIFQEYALVERLTVMENVLAGQLGYVGFWQSWWRNFPPAIVDEAFRLLERVGLQGLEDRRADALSGGQRQRVGIARALLQNPKLLLVDEPTASLDPKTALTIAALIRELAQERRITTPINIHNVALAKQFADRIVGLKAGEIIFDGTAADLTPTTLAEIYGAADWETTIETTPMQA